MNFLVAADGTGPLADAELHCEQFFCSELKKGGTTNRASSLWDEAFLRGKAEVPALPRQALEAWPVMAFFAIAGQAEATRGAGHWI